MFREAGLEVRGLEAAGDWLCVRTNAAPVHVEVKRAERLKLPEWLRQAATEAPADALPVVAFRQNHGRWHAVLELAELVELLR